MNHFHAKAEFIDGVWRAQVRYCHKAAYWTLMDGEKPAEFPTKADAEIAALRAQERHINGTIVGFGERLQSARALAGRVFGTDGPSRVFIKGREVAVERRRVR